MELVESSFKSKCVHYAVRLVNNERKVRLSGGTPWRYDGKASCVSKQIVILVLETTLDDEHPYNKFEDFVTRV